MTTINPQPKHQPFPIRNRYNHHIEWSLTDGAVETHLANTALMAHDASTVTHRTESKHITLVSIHSAKKSEKKNNKSIAPKLSVDDTHLVAAWIHTNWCLNKMIFNICSRLGSIFLGILTIFKKALCCFSRRRKRSNSECEVLSMVSVIQGDASPSRSKNRNDVSATSFVHSRHNHRRCNCKMPSFYSIAGHTRLEFVGWFAAHGVRTYRTVSAIDSTGKICGWRANRWLLSGKLVIAHNHTIHSFHSLTIAFLLFRMCIGHGSQNNQAKEAANPNGEFGCGVNEFLPPAGHWSRPIAHRTNSRSRRLERRWRRWQ